MAFLDDSGVQELAAQIHTLCGIEYATKDEVSALFKLKNYQYQRSFPANTTTAILGTEFNVSTPDGYTPIAIPRFNLGTTGLVLCGMHPTATESSSVMEVRNVTSSAKTQNVNIFILYVKSDYIE